MKLYPFQAELPALSSIENVLDFFPNVKSKYLKFKQQDLFDLTNKEAIFLYQITHRNGRLYQGIIASTDLQHYLDKDIKGHEATLTAKEQKQLKLLEKRKAQVKPILLTYRSVPIVDAWMTQQTRLKPAAEVELDGNKHTIWHITNSVEIRILADCFKQYVPTTYIADGHHRAASAAKLYQKKSKYNRIMAAFFSFKELDILDYNRVIEDPNMPKLLPHLREFFEVKKQAKPIRPKQKFNISLYYNQQWYGLKWKEHILDKNAKVLLDTDLLNRHIFKALFDIKDIRTAPNIDYVGGADGAEGIEKMVDAAPNRAGFWMHPVSVDDLTALVDLGEVLPPKSTWFEPRMLNGLTIFTIDNQ